MNFSKKLFTGFTATAVGISLIAGGFSVLAGGNDMPTSNGRKPANNTKSQETPKQGEKNDAKDDLLDTKKEYKTEAEITARINELKNTQAYKAYAAVQSEMVKEINLDKLVKDLYGLVGKILVNKDDPKKEREITKGDIESLVPQIKELISGVKKASNFSTWEEKTNHWEPKDSNDNSTFNELLARARSIQKLVKERDAAALSAKKELDEIKTLEAKLAELKKANKDTDNKSSDSKKQETKAKETNKNQKSSNGTNSATATKKADATKIKTGVE